MSHPNTGDQEAGKGLAAAGTAPAVGEKEEKKEEGLVRFLCHRCNVTFKRFVHKHFSVHPRI